MEKKRGKERMKLGNEVRVDAVANKFPLLFFNFLLTSVEAVSGRRDCVTPTIVRVDGENKDDAGILSHHDVLERPNSKSSTEVLLHPSVWSTQQVLSVWKDPESREESITMSIV